MSSWRLYTSLKINFTQRYLENIKQWTGGGTRVFLSEDPESDDRDRKLKSADCNDDEYDVDDADNDDHKDEDEIILGGGQKKEGGCSQHLGQHHQAVPSLPAWLGGDYFHVSCHRT